MSEFSQLGQLLSAELPTVVSQVNYPIHKGQPNPKHGKFYLSGRIPGGCVDPETNRSKFYDTEAEAIEAAQAAGARRIHDVKCRTVQQSRD